MGLWFKFYSCASLTSHILFVPTGTFGPNTLPPSLSVLCYCFYRRPTIPTKPCSFLLSGPPPSSFFRSAYFSPSFSMPCQSSCTYHILVLSILRTWSIHPNFLFAILSLTLMYLFCGTSFEIFSGHVHVVLYCAFFELPMATVS